MPTLSDHDLRQMDPTWQQRQPEDTVCGLLARALDDLRQARDRLNQGSGNSSRPSGSMEPWRGSAAAEAEVSAAQDGVSGDSASGQADDDKPAEPSRAQAASSPKAGADVAAPRGLGKPAGATGFGRTQKLALTDTDTDTDTDTECHCLLHCAACGGQALDEQAPCSACSGWDCVDLAGVPQVVGLRLEVARYLLMQQRCGCGDLSRAEPHRAADDRAWQGVAIGEQRLLGARLAAVVVFLCLRMRLSRQRVRG